jgi:hypothetical protein
MNLRAAPSVPSWFANPLAAGLLLLALVFSAAQLHGLTHGISHLGRGHAAPHASLCSDCIASADASAAPPSAIAVVAVAVVAAAFLETPAAPAYVARPSAAHRSRGPPSTPT